MAIKVHFLGIGGSGASAAAAIAQAQGYEVTGCDLEPHNEFTTNLKNSQLFKGHSPTHLYCHPERLAKDLFRMKDSNELRDSSPPEADQNDKMVNILAVTPAIYSLDPDNPELQAAKEKNIPIMTWQEFLGKYLTKDKFVIAVAGTHGKTTTTAMIAQILEDAGKDPTVLLGAIHPKWKTNHRVGKSKYFVVEADEFNDNFLHFTPDISAVTNIEMDHPEYFKDLEAVLESFKTFLLSTRQTVVANLSDSGVRQTYHGRDINVQIIDYSKHLIDFPLQIPGEFNRMNASAAYQVGRLLNIDGEVIKKSLSSYAGIGRRFEYIGEYKGAKIYSDFGHHPTEIKVTMEAAREKFPTQRIILIYEPHMFSRTKALFDDFVNVFREVPVDKIIITDIYPSREVDTGIVSSKQLADQVRSNRLVYHNKKKLNEYLKNQIKNGDIIFFMGAGDIDKLAKQLVG